MTLLVLGMCVLLSKTVMSLIGGRVPVRGSQIEPSGRVTSLHPLDALNLPLPALGFCEQLLWGQSMNSCGCRLGGFWKPALGDSVWAVIHWRNIE